MTGRDISTRNAAAEHLRGEAALPETGRWTAPDPLRYGGGLANIYEYAGDDPDDFVDPSGRFGFYVGGGGNALFWGPGAGVSGGFFIDWTSGTLSFGSYSNLNLRGGFGLFGGGGAEGGIIWNLGAWKGVSLGGALECPYGGVSANLGGGGVDFGPGALGAVAATVGTTTLLGGRWSSKTGKWFWGFL